MEDRDSLKHYDSTIRRFSQQYIEQQPDQNYLRLEMHRFKNYTDNEILKRLCKELRPKPDCMICQKQLDNLMLQLYCMFCGNNYCRSHFMKKRKFRDNVSNICMICEQKYIENMVGVLRKQKYDVLLVKVDRLKQDELKVSQQVSICKQGWLANQQQVQQLVQQIDQLQNQCRLQLTVNNQYKRMISQYKTNIENNEKIRQMLQNRLVEIQQDQTRIEQKDKVLQMQQDGCTPKLQDSHQMQVMIQKEKENKMNVMANGCSQRKTDVTDDQRLVLQQFNDISGKTARVKYKKNRLIDYGIERCKLCQIQ